MKKIFLSLLLFGTLQSKAQFTTPVVDGTIGTNEYGNHTAGQNASITVDGRTFFVTWDNTNLYVGSNNYSNGDDAVVFYLDLDPISIVNGGSSADGTLTGTGYDGVTPNLPFRADAFLFVKNGYTDYILDNGVGGWSSNNGNSSVLISNYNDANDVIEFSIPWTVLMNGGVRPAAFNFLAFLSYQGGGGGTFGRVPEENPGGISAVMNYYYTVSSTADASSSASFSQKSYAQNTGAVLDMPANTFYDFTVNNSSAVSFNNMVSVANSLTVANGSNVTTNRNLTLLSTAQRTARVAPVSGVINGIVNVERYFGIPSARRAWRLVTAPLTNANTIRNTWQDSGSAMAGRGTFITGPGGMNGLDAGMNYSMKMWDNATQTLVPVTNTIMPISANSGNADNRGYFLFVRGDRNPANLTAPNTNNTTVSADGILQVGTQTFDASDISGNFTLIGNPYASPINFDNVTRSNVVKRFYAWDPNLNTVGGYVLVDDVNEDGTYDITPSSTQTQQIQNGQAFFVQTTTSAPANVTFNETSKSDVNTNAGFRTSNSTTERFRTNLYLRNADNSTTLADGVLAEYNALYDNSISITEDANKMTNLNENIAILRDGQAFALERRALITSNDTLYLKLWNTTARNYQLEFVPSNLSLAQSAYLEDTYLKTSTPLSLTSPTTINFSVTSNPASADANRFRVVFKTSGALPAMFTSVKGWQKGTGVQVDWNVAAESNIRYYQVEKSVNGRDFTKTSEVPAITNNNNAVSYNWFDANAVKGNNWYRIKVLDRGGSVKYSQVVNVKIAGDKGDIVIYPNPVRGKTISLQFTNQPEGSYTARLINNAGQAVSTRVIQHAGGSSTQTMNLSGKLPKGVYRLQISNGETVITQQLISE